MGQYAGLLTALVRAIASPELVAEPGSQPVTLTTAPLSPLLQGLLVWMVTSATAGPPLAWPNGATVTEWERAILTDWRDSLATSHPSVLAEAIARTRLSTLQPGGPPPAWRFLTLLVLAGLVGVLLYLGGCL